MPKFSIITINYGNSQKIKKLWESLAQKSPKNDFEFIVVDNASPNEDGEAIRVFLEDKQECHTILLHKNLGFGGGYKEGVKFAQGEYLGVINPDIEVKANCLEALLEVLEKKENAGIVAPRLLNHDETPQQNARKFPTVWVMFGRRLSSKFKWAYDSDPAWYKTEKVTPVDWVQGSFMLMKTKFFTETLQGFDPRFFLFLEDTDLCRRTWEKDKRVLLVPEAQAYHGEERLSGGHFWKAIWKKTFWVHVQSAWKYFFKYLFKKKPKVK